MASASVRCLCDAAATIAVLASLTGLYRRAAVGWAVVGLALGLLLGAPLALSDPATALAVAVPTAAVVFAIAQWR